MLASSRGLREFERDRHKAFKIGELDLERNLLGEDDLERKLLGELDLERNLLGEDDLERNLPREDGLEDDIVDVVPTKPYFLCKSGRESIKARITWSFMLGR